MGPNWGDSFIIKVPVLQEALCFSPEPTLKRKMDIMVYNPSPEKSETNVFPHSPLDSQPSRI